MTDRDRAVLDFARTKAVDFVGISFVDGKDLVERVRSRLGPGGPRVVAKIESSNGMAHLEEVVAAADAIMIDRGDLSVETNLEGIALAQKRIVTVAMGLGKPVIIATEMLHTMIENPVPTKAEVTDISNAILDGASALMLSGETAVGRFPQAAVETMRRIADVVAASVVPRGPDASDDEAVSVPHAMGEAVALVSRLLPVTKIVAITRSGYAARVVANYRPRQEILVVTDDPATARSANLLFGCRGVAVDVPFLRRSTDHIAACLEELWHRGLLTADDIVLVTSVGYPHSGRRMNLIQTHAVADLRTTLGWAEPRAVGEAGAAKPTRASAPDSAGGRAAR
jgi:pyruvate kinase